MGVLRLILAVTVVLAHSDALFGLTFTGAVVAVQVFFMISGFYMAMVLDLKYQGRGAYRIFLINRILRLYPIFLTVLVLTIVVSLVSFMGSGEWLRLEPYVLYFTTLEWKDKAYLLLSNFLILGQDLALFLGIDAGRGVLYFTPNFLDSNPTVSKFLIVPQAWTLSLELMFYFVAPFLVRFSWKLLVSLIIVSLSLRLFVYFPLGLAHDPWTYRFFPTELALFLLGLIAYRLVKTGFIQSFSDVAQRWVVILFFSVLLCYQFLPFVSGGLAHVKNWLFYLFAVVALPIVFERTKHIKWDSQVGELSYPIYISHWLVIMLIQLYQPGLDRSNLQGEFALLYTVIFSITLIYFISRPVENIRQKIAKKLRVEFERL